MDMGEIKMISIIVPVYNVDKYLRECVESLISQTYSDIEIILVNDGSTDTSGQICDEYGNKYDNIHVFHTENRGLSAARNVGLENCHGEYIGFVDSDDWVEPEMYEELYNLITSSNADLSSCSMKADYSDKNITMLKNCESFAINKKEFFSAIVLNKKVYGYVCNKLFKKSIIQSLRFDENLLSQEDMDFTMRYAAKSENFAYTHSEYYHYRQRSNSMTGETAFNERKLSIITTYERALDVYKIYCPECIEIIECNYLKVNINVIGRMGISNYNDINLKTQLKNNAKKYLKKVLLSNISITQKLNILISYAFPTTMLRIKYLFK